MLSIGRLGTSDAKYYCSQVARGAEDYYLDAGEAPGRWVGAGAAEAGIDGTVTEEGLARVLDGRNLLTGARLVPGADGRVPGFDLTFSAPESVSVLWALGDPDVTAAVAAAHDRAVADALGYLESDATWARRGSGGTTQRR